MNNRWQSHWIITLGVFLIILSPSAAIPALQTSAAIGDPDLLHDGQLHVVLCGTGSPLPDRNRAQACTAIIAGGEFVLVGSTPGGP